MWWLHDGFSDNAIDFKYKFLRRDCVWLVTPETVRFALWKTVTFGVKIVKIEYSEYRISNILNVGTVFLKVPILSPEF